MLTVPGHVHVDYPAFFFSYPYNTGHCSCKYGTRAALSLTFKSNRGPPFPALLSLPPAMLPALLLCLLGCTLLASPQGAAPGGGDQACA